MSSTPSVKWSLDADFLQACNCDYGCPCEFSAPPTLGYCEGLGAWRINRGRYGDVVLDGLALGFAARWPKAIHEGNGTVCLFVDDRANAAQREALLKIGSGAAGGMPFEIIATTFSTVMEPRFERFEFRFNGHHCSVQIGDSVAAGTTPIRNPVTGEAEFITVKHTTGFIFKDAEAVSATDMRVQVNGLKFSWPKKAAFIAQVQYAN